MAANDGRVVSNFIVQALKGNPITVYGDGTQTRSFCYVDDLIDGLIKLFFKERVFEPINLGNSEEINILQVAKEILDLTESKSKIELRPLPEDDPTNRKPDTHQAFNLLAWTPKINRKDGLKSTISYFKAKNLLS
jgi:UDP-glucuronate decarboxylase